MAKISHAPNRTFESVAGQLGRLDDFIGFRLRRIQNQLSKDFAEANQACGHNLRSGLFSSLAIIAANPGISQSEVSRHIGQDKSITVQIVDDLERGGHAERRRSPTDRRRHALYITPDGERFLDELFANLASTEAVMSQQLTRAEQHLLHELLDRIYEHWAR